MCQIDMNVGHMISVLYIWTDDLLKQLELAEKMRYIFILGNNHATLSHWYSPLFLRRNSNKLQNRFE